MIIPACAAMPNGIWPKGAEELCHGLCQALQKRALPRALMSDNGSAMLAAETTEGLARLGIVHEKTLPYAPFQNGKQESYWNGIEGRLLPMLEGVADLTLAQLNEATQAWIEMEYNRSVHSELGEAPSATLPPPPRRRPALSIQCRT
jgi:transposase InsO family protein